MCGGYAMACLSLCFNIVCIPFFLIPVDAPYCGYFENKILGTEIWRKMCANVTCCVIVCYREIISFVQPYCVEDGSRRHAFDVQRHAFGSVKHAVLGGKRVCFA